MYQKHLADQLKINLNCTKCNNILHINIQWITNDESTFLATTDYRHLVTDYQKQGWIKETTYYCPKCNQTYPY